MWRTPEKAWRLEYGASPATNSESDIVYPFLQVEAKVPAAHFDVVVVE
jgi:hypothetical protein